MARLLFISYYRDKYPTRQMELEKCLLKNIENEHIDKIFVLLEGKKEDFPELNYDKLVVFEDTGRPNYRHFFNVMNALSREGDVCILANTDIYFDDTIQLADRLNENSCFALSRYDIKPDGFANLHNEQYSQDVWIFRGKIKKVNYCDFHLGVPGCDNRIAYELHKAGYTVTNPALSLRAYHYHPSDLHTYDGTHRIDKPFMPVPLTRI